MTAERARTEPDRDVTEFYDIADVVLTTIWGDDFHSGYWESPEDESSNAEALRRMNDTLIADLGVAAGDRVLDLGSGLGAPAFRLAEVTEASVLGVTVSQPQVDESNQRARARGLDHLVSFERADAHALPYPAGSFDAAWVIESFIHMDRPRALAQLARVLRPGGTLLFTDVVQPERGHPAGAGGRRRPGGVAIAVTAADVEGLRRQPAK